MLKSIPSSPFMPLFIKLIDFNEKVVSDVTSETTFSLKSIYLMKREDERGMRGACVAPLILPIIEIGRWQTTICLLTLV
jgi:hypothetical protein